MPGPPPPPFPTLNQSHKIMASSSHSIILCKPLFVQLSPFHMCHSATGCLTFKSIYFSAQWRIQIGGPSPGAVEFLRSGNCFETPWHVSYIFALRIDIKIRITNIACRPQWKYMNVKQSIFTTPPPNINQTGRRTRLGGEDEVIVIFVHGKLYISASFHTEFVARWYVTMPLRIDNRSVTQFV